MTTPETPPKGEEMLLEVFIQRRKNPETQADEFWFDHIWQPFGNIDHVLEAVHGLKLGNLFGDVPLSEVPADVQASLEGELRKLHPTSDIKWGEETPDPAA